MNTANRWVIARKNEELYYGSKNGDLICSSLEDADKYDIECEALFVLEDAIELSFLDASWEVRKV